jgi:hypothetical protein
VDCVVDPDDAIGRHYGLGPERIATIRPDGSLGLVANSADPALVHRYHIDTLRFADRAAV